MSPARGLHEVSGGMDGGTQALPVRIYVLVLAMPTATAREPASEITLETIESTRGERVGHVGRVPRPTTTAEHRWGKHAA
jgi:hypothetical protein